MSLLSWMFPTRPAQTANAGMDSAGLSRMESTRPVAATARAHCAPQKNGAGANNAKPANRKHERMARRELLYAVVRDCMTHAGVLTASYKFKVLSLDARGRQFLVMVDLAGEYGLDSAGLAEVEAMIAQGAKSFHDIIVTAVYWRLNDHVAVGVSAVHAQAPRRFEPIQAEEVAAFKRALAASSNAIVAGDLISHPAQRGASARALDGSGKHGPQNYTLLTGYEDTEMPDAEEHHAPALSGTQYGELR